MVIEERIGVRARPLVAWELVASPSAMTRLSSEVVSVEWVDLTPALAGSVFRGHHRVGPFRWSTTNVIERAVPGKVFAWRTVEGRGSSVMLCSYEFSRTPNGCEIAERFRPGNWLAAAECRLGRGLMIRRAMRATLRKLSSMLDGGA